MQGLISRSIGALAALLLFSVTADAALVQVTWSGTLTSVPAGFSSIAPVDAISGSFVYDSNAALNAPASTATIALYNDDFTVNVQIVAGLTTFNLAISGHDPQVRNDHTSIGTSDDFRVGYYGGLELPSPSGDTIDGLTMWGVAINLIDTDANVFSSLDLPVALSFSEFESATGTLFFSTNPQSAGTDLRPTFTLSSLTTAEVSTIPIPAAAWLFGSGLGMLGWIRRRQTA